MRQRWYSKATVQASLVTGVFLLLATFLAGGFSTLSTWEGRNESRSPVESRDDFQSEFQPFLRDSLDLFELVLVLDRTASNLPFMIDAVQAAADTQEALAKTSVELRVGVVAFGDRTLYDHDVKQPLVTERLLALTASPTVLREIGLYEESGGGDLAEAVFDGLNAAFETTWTHSSNRAVLLITDAAPHLISGSRNPNGYSIESLMQDAALQRVRVHVLSIAGHEDMRVSYSRLASGVNPSIAGQFLDFDGSGGWESFRITVRGMIDDWIAGVRED